VGHYWARNWQADGTKRDGKRGRLSAYSIRGVPGSTRERRVNYRKDAHCGLRVRGWRVQSSSNDEKGSGGDGAVEAR